MAHKEKAPIRLESCHQMGELYRNIVSDLRAVQKVKELLGYDCFTEEAREMIGTLRMLKRMYSFSETVEDFNEQLQEVLSKDDETARNIRRYIEWCIERKEE